MMILQLLFAFGLPLVVLGSGELAVGQNKTMTQPRPWYRFYEPSLERESLIICNLKS